MRNIVIIGGGAAGLTAALTAAGQGHSVTVLERLPRVGKKLLLTGNGRCNLGNRDRDFSHYHGSVYQAEAILRAFDPEAFFREIGVFVRTDSEGRMYPASNTAASVLDALRLTAEQRGAEIRCGVKVTGLSRSKKGWTVSCEDGSKLSADSVICAAGGSAAPSCGTDGSFLHVLRGLGIPIIAPKPALCPVPTAPARVKALKGMRVRAAASLLRGGKTLRKETGEVQFTEQALSGICIFNLSRDSYKKGADSEISLNLLYEFTSGDIPQMLQTLTAQRNALPASDLMTGLLPKRVGECVLKDAGISPASPISALTPEMIGKLARTLCDWRFPVTGQADFSKAQVTAGGVPGDCLTETLEVRGMPGLYICGELADIDGDCGGYNLMFAFAGAGSAGLHFPTDT